MLRKFALLSLVLLAVFFPSLVSASCTSDAQCPSSMRCDVSMGTWGACEPRPTSALQGGGCSTDDDCPATCSNGMLQRHVCRATKWPDDLTQTCEKIGDPWRCSGKCDASRVPLPCAFECSSDGDCPSKCSNGMIEEGYCVAGECLSDVPKSCPSGTCADSTKCAEKTATAGCTSNQDCTTICIEGLMYNANCIDGACTGTRWLFGEGGKGVPCEGGPKDKCAGVTCKEQYCQGNTRYYNGQCSKETGKCVYNNVECPLGCNTEKGFCIQEEKLALTGLELSANKYSLVLNGRDAVKVSGKAYAKDSAGKKVPYKGELRFEETGEASGYRIFGPSAVHISVDPSATAKADGTFSFFVSSEEKIGPKVDLKGAKLIVSSSDMKSVKMEIALKSPAPVIKKFKLKNKPTVWQDSYGVFEVEVEDPDGNIKEYTVRSEQGAIRLYGVEWGEEKQVTHTSKDPKFEFGWKAPKLTKEMKLDYTKKIYERVKAAVSKVAKKAIKDKVDEKLKQRALQTGGKSGVRWTPNTDEMQALVDAGTSGSVLNTSDVIAKYVVTRNKLSRKAYKETTEPINAIYEKGEALVELYKVQEEATAETAAQAQELGEASTEDASFFEYAARVGIIGIQGYKMYDGVMSTGDKLAGVKGDESFMGTVKDAAKELTIGSVEDSLKFVADNYKAARAKMLSLPFVLKVQVTDEDGYTATKGVLVEVEGYERVIVG